MSMLDQPTATVYFIYGPYDGRIETAPSPLGNVNWKYISYRELNLKQVGTYVRRSMNNIGTVVVCVWVPIVCLDLEELEWRCFDESN